MRSFYRDNGWSASKIRDRSPEFANLWEWVDRLPENERRVFLTVHEWDDGDKFIFLQIAKLYQHTPHVRHKPSSATIYDWRKKYRASLRPTPSP